MRNIRHILVPTDFGAPSSAAVELAIDLAQSLDAELTLLHVWEKPDYPYLELMANSPEIARVENAALTRLAEADFEIPHLQVGTTQTLPSNQALHAALSCFIRCPALLDARRDEWRARPEPC